MNLPEQVPEPVKQLWIPHISKVIKTEKVHLNNLFVLMLLTIHHQEFFMNVHSIYFKELEKKDKYNSVLLGFMDKSGLMVPEEIAKESPVSLIHTPSNFLRVSTNFTNHPWVKEYSKGVVPSNEDILQDLKEGRFIVARGLGPSLGLETQYFKYSNAGNIGKCKYGYL